MKWMIHLLLWALVSSCAFTPRSAPELTGDLKLDLEILLPNGTVEVDVIDGVVVDPRYENLYAKMMQSLSENREWFLEQQQIATRENSIIPYHPNIGLTEGEYEDFLRLMEEGPGMEMVKSGTEEVMFEYNGNIIQFGGTGKLEILNEVEIDLTEKVVWLGDKKLDALEEVIVDTDENGLKSKWRGYKWSYSKSNLPGGLSDLGSIEDIQSLDIHHCTLTIGLLESDNKTYIEISEKITKSGEKIKSVQIPFKF